MTMTNIYGLVDAYGTIRYVGKTTCALARRCQQHVRDGKRWAVGIVLLEVTSESDWKDAEKRQIAIWSQWEDLENRNPGGGGSWCWSPEAKIAMSALKMGHMHSAETRLKIGAAHKGRRKTDETRARISSAKKGTVVSPEARTRMSIAQSKRWGKLIEDDVYWIFERRRDGWTQQRIADALGVSNVTICKILQRKYWGHLNVVVS